MTSAMRNVVITGASAGVGRAIALSFAQAKFRVALLARSETGLDSARREIEAGGGKAASYPVDVADAHAVFGAADAIASAWGSIDIWINCAMLTIFAEARDIAPDEFKRVTDVTYLGYVYGTMAALKHMRPRNAGTILQIGSALSYRAIPLQSAYCGAKFAIRGFTDSLRSELQHEDSAIRISMIQLPAVNTPQFDWARNKMGRLARPLPPIFQPEVIARHVLRAATEPPRELWIGWPTVKTILANMLIPAYLDRRLARIGYRKQMAHETRSPDLIDNLDASPPAGHVARGRFDILAKSSVAAFNPAYIRAAAVLCATAVIIILALLVSRI